MNYRVINSYPRTEDDDKENLKVQLVPQLRYSDTLAHKLLEQSEMDKKGQNLTVRIKLVDLNYSGLPMEKPATRGSGAHVSALIGAVSERNTQPQVTGIRWSEAEHAHGEICLRTGQTVPHSDFEAHLEICSICANRIELQLDFIETLETAMYQSRVEPQSSKLRGALLVSSPELNFAICGELEV